MHPKRYNRIQSAFFATPWAILPEKLDEIIAFIELKSAGHAVSEADVAAAVAQQVDRDVRPPTGTAILSMHGVITHRANMLSSFSGGTSTELLGKQFTELMNDPEIGRIVIDADTPGGAVPGTADTARLIHKGSQTKEVITVFGGYGASAGYWLGSAAGRVVAIPSAYAIGSIGAIFVHRVEDDPDATVTVLRSVPNKALINDVEKPTTAAIDQMKAKLATIHEMFVGDVAAFRGVTPETVNGSFGQGGTFMAADALAIGLIDEIGTLADVLQQPIRNPTTTSVRVTTSVMENPTMKLTSRIKVALITAGLCTASSSNDDFQAALDLHAEAVNQVKAGTLAEDADEAAILASFQPKETTQTTTKPATTTTAGGGNPETTLTADLAAQIGLKDVQALVQISAVPADRKFDVMSAIMTDVTAGEIKTVDQITQAIQKAQAQDSKMAGHTTVTVKKESRDKIVEAAIASIVTREYGDGSEEAPTHIIGMDNKKVDLASVTITNEVRSIPRIIETIMTDCYGARVVSQMDETSLVQAFFAGDLSDSGVSAADGPAYNTTGLFRKIVYNANQVIALKEYGSDEVDYRRWCSRGSDLANFDKVTFKGIGSLTAPKAIGEDGEFSDMTFIGYEEEEGKLALWGGEYTYTWQLALADDLNFLTGVQRKMVRGIANKEDNVAHEYLTGNPKMKDGTRLFVNGTNELQFTGTVPYTQTIVKKAKQMLYHQKPTGHDDAKDGDSDHLKFRMRQIIQPLSMEEAANEYFDSKSPSGSTQNSGRSNVHQNLVTKDNRVTVGMLDTDAGGSDYTWYGHDMRNGEWMQWHNLRGFTTPKVRTFESRSRLAMGIQIYKPFGIFAKSRHGVIRVVVNQSAGAGVFDPDTGVEGGG